MWPARPAAWAAWLRCLTRVGAARGSGGSVTGGVRGTAVVPWHERKTTTAWLVLTLLLTALAPLAPTATAPADAAPLPPPDPGSVLVPCGQAGVRGNLTVDSHLDPSCTYTAGFDITASDVTLDCQGATIAGPSGGPFNQGVTVRAPVTVALHGVRVRNCHISGFGNSLRVTRTGFKDLAVGVEYDHAFSDIAIEDSEMTGSRGVGIYVDGYVTGVTIQRNHIHGAGSSGVYLETGSKDNVVHDNDIVGNGFKENGSEGTLTVFNGLTVRYWGPGREGISVDSSRFNQITGNRISGNSAGGIFLYKNCGEYYIIYAGSWMERRYGANGNLIEGNTISDGLHGVWVGARMGENTYPMECSSPAYSEGPLERYVLDEATDNVVRGNSFSDVTYGVHVEDDRTTVEGNTFAGPDAGFWAVIIGTRMRTPVLGLPVRGTVLQGNSSTIVGNASPYRWVHGQVDTTVEANTALDRVVGICEVPELPHNPMVMVIALAVEDPNGPPTPPPDLTVPTLGAQASCADVTAATSTTTTTTAAHIAAAPVTTSAGSVTPAFTG